MTKQAIAAAILGWAAASSMVAQLRSTGISKLSNGWLSEYSQLVRSSGMYAGFEAGSPTWVQNTGTITYDTAHVSEGSRALKFVTAAGGTASSTASLSVPPSSTLTFDMYTAAPESVLKFQVYFTSNNFTGWLEATQNPANLSAGWNTVVFTQSDLTLAGSGMVLTDWSSITKARIQIYSKPGMVSTVWIDRYRWIKTRAAITFTFDDGYDSVYSAALPIMRAHGWAGTVYVVTGCANQPSCTIGSATFTALTTARSLALQAAGWDISSHSVTHAHLISLSYANQLAELQTSYDWLAANGFRSGARFLATPYGEKNADTIAAASLVYANLRDASAAGNAGVENPWLKKMYKSTLYGLRYSELPSGDGLTPAAFQAKVDSAIARGNWLIIVAHSIDGDWLSAGLFRQYLDYLETKRAEIDVLTMGQYWNRRARSLSSGRMN